MRQIIFFIGFIFLSYAPSVWSIIEHETFPTHYRLQLFVPKSRIKISKEKQKVILKIEDEITYKNIHTKINNLKLNKKYISKINLDDSPSTSGTNFYIKFELSTKNIEQFSFYQESSKSYIIDLWTDRSSPPAKSKTLSKKSHNPKQKINKESKYRDFRYGASFIINYPPLRPLLENEINLKSKTPEYFYPIKNRDITKNEIEAHLQLSINLYRKGKWGLMNKSISLFQKKYGENLENDLNDYLKACSLIKSELKNNEKGLFKMGINILDNITARTNNSELKVQLLKYLIQFFIEEKNFVNVLDYAKKLYVSSRSNFDSENELKSIKYILHSLSILGQVDQIGNFIEDKSIKDSTPHQVIMAYKIFVNRKVNNYEEIINIYENKNKILQKPILPSIIYNTAEAYFQLGKYQKAIELFDQFVKDFSYLKQAAHSRLRLALSYDLLNKPYDEVVALYKNVIDKVSSKLIRYEAKIRFVGISWMRDKSIGKDGNKFLPFLEIKKEDAPIITKDLKELLWLVRLRTFILNEDYANGLVYLRGIPLLGMNKTTKRVFEGEASELVYGLILDHYHQGNFGLAVKDWEFYRKKYLDKTARILDLGFIISHSYLKLGLIEGFNRTLEYLKSNQDHIKRKFPRWIEKYLKSNSKIVFSELKLIKIILEKNYELADKTNKINLQKYPKYQKYKFYQGMINYHQNKYHLAIKNFKDFLINKDQDDELNKNEVSDLFAMYTDSLFKLQKLDDFLKISRAALSDLKEHRNSKNKKLNNFIENLSYQYIEAFMNHSSYKLGMQISPLISDHLKNYPKSLYRFRLKYLLAMAYLKDRNNKQAEEILISLTNNNEIPNYIKELAISELSTIRLMKQKL